MTTFDKRQPPFEEETDQRRQSDEGQLQFDEVRPESNGVQSKFGDTLQHLVTEVQQQPSRSRQRMLAYMRLFQEIEKPSILNVLKRNLQGNCHGLSSGLYEDLFDEAWQETKVSISRYIDDYDSNRSLFINWVRKILTNKFIDVTRKYSKRGISNQPKNNQIPIISIDGLQDFQVDNICANELYYHDDSSSNFDLLRHVLINDPDNKFKKHVKDKPHITFQYIAIAMHIKGKKMIELSRELGVSNGTLFSFFQRELDRLKPYLQDLF